MDISEFFIPLHIKTKLMMKEKFLFMAMLSMLAVMNIEAENYPYRSDVLWVTRPDHADWLYECGEKANIDVEFFKYGIPRDGVIEYEIATDMLKADKTGKVEKLKLFLMMHGS